MLNLNANQSYIKMTLSEQDLKLFKKWLRSHLNYGPVTVTFVKKDGSERVMECTTNTSLVPQVLHETNTNNPVDFPAPKKERKINEDIMPVYDLESQAWKSFRWDSIKQVRLTL